MATVPGSAHMKKTHLSFFYQKVPQHSSKGKQCQQKPCNRAKNQYQKPVNHFKKPPYSPLPASSMIIQNPQLLQWDWVDMSLPLAGRLSQCRMQITSDPWIGSTRISDQMDQDTLPGIPRSDFAWRGYLHCPLLKKISYFVFYQLVSFLGCYCS